MTTQTEKIDSLKEQQHQVQEKKNAQETVGEWEKNKSNLFYDGKALAYYEMLDIIKTELDIREQDLKEFGLDVSLEEKLLA